MIELSLKEPSQSPYLYINPETNTVHLLLPVISSTQDGDMEIGADNTCKSVYALQEFFGLSSTKRDALRILEAYQTALEHDLLLPIEERLRIAKTSRLEQIKMYVELVSRIKKEEAIIGCLGRE